MHKDVNGIYTYDDSQKLSTAFTNQVQDDLYDIEDESWWFQLRARLILSASKHFLKKNRLTIDVGGGNGYTTMVMKRAGFRMGLLEPSYKACIHAKERGIDPVICGSIGRQEDKWQQCMLLDVLEHIEDDEAFIRALFKEMKPEGRLLITVPAMKVLWSSEDDEAGHFRRYDRRMLTNVLRKNGFKVIYCSYFYSWLMLPVFIVRVGMEKLGIIKTTQQRSHEEKLEIEGHQFKQKNKFINKILTLLNILEIKAVRKRKSIPFGSSLICLVEKRK